MRRVQPAAARGRLAACLALAWALACASQAPPPEWVQGSSSQYPDDRYSVGVASNARAEAAAQMALAAIAEQTHGESRRAADASPGPEVVDSWFDADHESHWALAAFDRAARVAALNAELTQVDARIAAALSAAETGPAEAALSDLAGAAAQVADRDALRARLADLGARAKADDAAAARQAAAIDSALAAAKRQLRIEVESYEMDARTGEAGDPLDATRRALTQKVLALGFTPAAAEVAWGTDPVWLRVESKVAFERLELHPQDRLVAVHWDATVEISDIAGGGDVVAVLSEEGRSVHTNEREARRRADIDARSFATAALEDWLTRRSGAAGAAR